MTSIERLIERIGDAAPIEVVVDVGAHIGTDSLPVAREFSRLRVFAVEPTPSLAERLRESSRDLPNYTVIEAAIDTAEIERTFNLVGKGLAGFNSLNEYAPGIESSWEGLPPVTERIRVRTQRLDTVCDDHGIDAIDILHVDTQGSDVNVLLSLGDRLDRVKAGVIEVSRRLKLYATSVHRDEARAFLEARGFVVVDLRPAQGGEQNMLFVQRQIEGGLIARVAPGLLYRALVLRCALLPVLVRVRQVPSSVRAKVAVRTRLRRFAS
jgi:FkbM family methyltransferase